MTYVLKWKFNNSWIEDSKTQEHVYDPPKWIQVRASSYGPLLILTNELNMDDSDRSEKISQFEENFRLQIQSSSIESQNQTET